MERVVLYVNPLTFPIAVERRILARLAGRPVALAPGGTDRAIVWSASPEAARAGIMVGMPIYQALRCCPDLVILPPRLALYRRAAAALERILLPFVPVVEPHTLGHAYGDLTGTRKLFGPAPDVAARGGREVWGRPGAPRPGARPRGAAGRRAARAGRHRRCPDAAGPVRRPPRRRGRRAARARHRPRRRAHRRGAPAHGADRHAADRAHRGRPRRDAGRGTRRPALAVRPFAAGGATSRLERRDRPRATAVRDDEHRVCAGVKSRSAPLYTRCKRVLDRALP